MRPGLPYLLLACLVPTLSAARPAATGQQWFSVLLDGRKIGQFESHREVRADTVVTTQSLQVVLERAGIRIALGSSETSTESRDGRPLAFRASTNLSGSETVVEGTVRDGQVEVRSGAGGAAQARVLPWPDGALLVEGQRLAALKAGLRPGTRYRTLAYQPSSLEAFAVDSVVGPTEKVELPGGARTLQRIEQTMALPGTALQSRAWVDDTLAIHKLTLPLMGVELTLLACDQACAQAANQESDVFERTLAVSPRAISVEERQGVLRYTLSTDGSGDGGESAFPDTDEQSVRREGARWIITVDRRAGGRRGAGPAPRHSQPNEWLQSGEPEITALARRAVEGATTPAERMQRIEEFVRGFIATKSLGVGYASALDVARKPEGDCTEHALLLAAIGRAAGIPTRVVDGLAYAPGFAGRDRVFVPHAWVQAWVDGHWRSYDAALDGFDAGHIVLATGDGDPWKFYAGLDLLGSLRIEQVEAVAPGQP